MMQRQPVSYGRLFMRHFLWVPLIPMSAGLVFSVIAWVTIATENRLARDGVETVALITDRAIRNERDSDGNSVTRHYLSYRFTPTAGETVTARASVSRDSYRAVEVGQSVTVRYLPDDPGTNRLAVEGSDRVFGMVFGIIGLLLLMASGGALWWLLRGKLSAIRAARHGEVREAEVVGHDPTNTSVNGRLQYRFRWVDAVREQGQSTMMDYNSLPPLGQVVKVYIDPRTGRGWAEQDF